jgi:hypothetical protein
MLPFFEIVFKMAGIHCKKSSLSAQICLTMSEFDLSIAKATYCIKFSNVPKGSEVSDTIVSIG